MSEVLENEGDGANQFVRLCRNEPVNSLAPKRVGSKPDWTSGRSVLCLEQGKHETWIVVKADSLVAKATRELHSAKEAAE